MSFATTDEPENLDDEFKRCIGITLSDANQLVRWYRYLSRDYRAIEVVSEQVSPIIVTVFTDDSSLSYKIHFRRSFPRPKLLGGEQLDAVGEIAIQQSECCSPIIVSFYQNYELRVTSYELLPTILYFSFANWLPTF